MSGTPRQLRISSVRGEPSRVQIAWTGPFTIQTYLDNAISREPVWGERWPRERDAIYVVSQHEWSGQPDERAHVLYVGGNTGQTSRFVTRIGDLLADMFGFFGEETGHHSGGQTLWRWCNHNNVRPTTLWLGWGTSECSRCSERFMFDTFARAPKDDLEAKGLRNKISPPACPIH